MKLGAQDGKIKKTMTSYQLGHTGGERMKTIAVIGGSQKQTLERLARKQGCSIIFHSGKTGKKREKEFLPILRKADCVVIMAGALNHPSMWTVREVAEKLGKPIVYHQGFGATGALQKGAALIN
ncbi:hypothetical protein HMPREF0083_04282 [Aneurinibacillus aneurinilyticus ATCC 12856]|uniref:DUF2325 domain-containing protein n=2 Tax=Aneurinibacillus aneurinilyticus TaxID=1391 RepID=U1WZB5_ANEAE|nr:hypothetical protein HMPREF0083_04282 [Aneurinibacillus aneurinilyticus ATCC 12856]